MRSSFVHRTKKHKDCGCERHAYSLARRSLDYILSYAVAERAVDSIKLDCAVRGPCCPSDNSVAMPRSFLTLNFILRLAHLTDESHWLSSHTYNLYQSHRVCKRTVFSTTSRDVLACMLPSHRY